jgi:hypothetical protein
MPKIMIRCLVGCSKPSGWCSCGLEKANIDQNEQYEGILAHKKISKINAQKKTSTRFPPNQETMSSGMFAHVLSVSGTLFEHLEGNFAYPEKVPLLGLFSL